MKNPNLLFCFGLLLVMAQKCSSPTTTVRGHAAPAVHQRSPVPPDTQRVGDWVPQGGDIRASLRHD